MTPTRPRFDASMFERRPRPAVAADPGLEPWPLALVQMAIAHHQSARAVRREADRVVEARPDLEPWTTLAIRQDIDAQNLLLHAILLTDPDLPDELVCAPQKHCRPVRGVVDRGKVYLAVPDWNRMGDVGPDECCPSGLNMMVLVEADAAAIVAVDGR